MTASIADDWGLSFFDLMFLADQPEDMRMEVALQLPHLRRTGRFIEDWSCVPSEAVSYVASQVERPADIPTSLFDDRRSRRYRLSGAKREQPVRPTPPNSGLGIAI